MFVYYGLFFLGFEVFGVILTTVHRFEEEKLMFWRLQDEIGGQLLLDVTKKRQKD